MQETSSNKVFGGWSRSYKHASSECGCDMQFTIYYPPACDRARVPVCMFLSGLTCTDQNFVTKAGAQRAASDLGLALLAPDTSPRGLGIPGEDDSWDFGTGAGFYVDATEAKWRRYRMYSYVVKELPALLASDATASERLDLSNMSIFGHSMGGHGALTIALKHSAAFKSASAFSPICNPMNCPWGKKAFTGYLGTDESTWAQYDASELLRSYTGRKVPILVDVGTNDSFLKSGQLLPESLEAANKGPQLELTLRRQEGYDHSYFFIATFVEDHLRFHATHLGVL